MTTASVADMDKWTRDFYFENETECKDVLMEPGNWEKVPLFANGVAPGTLVRFKGMIQDMLNPEYYSKNFSLINSRYIAILDQSEDDVQTEDENFMERQVIACIPIPGLNEWAEDVPTNDENESQLEQNANKRIRLDPANQTNLKEVFIYVYIEEVIACELKVNSIIDVVGFLDLRADQEDNEDLEETSSTVQESYCIHTIQYKMRPDLMHDNEKMNDSIWKEASNLHAELKLILTQALLGDALAADYLLFYLVSSIYNRQHDRAPGKFSLNIRGFPMHIEKTYLNKLYSLISYLVVKSKYLTITIDNLNNMDMIPKKCYNSNRLSNGFLQLSNRTHLVLDETELEPGKLETIGMQNLQALENVINNQKLQYDFTYYKIDYDTQIPVLTLSIGKSLLPNDVDIELRPDPSCLNNTDELVDSAFEYLNSQSLLLEKLRKYIAIISTIDFNFNENVLKDIENDYVQMRIADPKNVSPDDLHRFLMISKLIALCLGKNELDKDIWEKCLSLENDRKLRNS